MFFAEDKIPDDARETADAAGLLEVTEFRLFHMAYTEWFGHTTTDAVIEPVFVVFMFRGTAPYWVRWFNRRVIDMGQRTDFDRRRFGLPKSAADYRAAWRGGVYITIVVAVVTLLLVALIGSADLPAFAKGCYFPPCY